MRGFSLLLLLFAAALRAEALTEPVPLVDLFKVTPGARIPVDESRKATLSATIPVDEWDGFGFLPVMIHAENKSDSDYTWRFVFDHGTSQGRDKGLRFRSEFSVTAPAHTSRSTVLWVPGGHASANVSRVSLSMTVSGPGVQGFGWSTSVLNGWRGGGVSYAVSPQLESEHRAWHEKTKHSHGNAPGLSTVRPADWPADWRVWSPFAVVIMRQSEFDALDTARQAALRDWVLLGGQLYLKPSAGTSAGRNIDVNETRHGLGNIIMADLPVNMRSTDEGKGEIIRGHRTRPWMSLMRMVEVDDTEALQLSSVVWWLMLFLLIFGVAIGPVNLFLLAPEGRRHRLFFTVPVISIGASVILMAVIVFRDGFGGEGMRRSLVMLFPDENKAMLAQQQVSRTGVLIGKKFPLADDVLFGKTGLDSGDEIAGKVAARDGGTASGDWFTSRAVESHVLLRVTPTRERVEVVADGKAPVVQSSMSGVLRDFFYMDENKRVWMADEVPPGRRVTLSPHNNREKMPEVLYAMNRKNGRRCFHATMTGGELALIDTLDSIRWTDDKTTVIGYVEGGARHE